MKGRRRNDKTQGNPLLAGSEVYNLWRNAYTLEGIKERSTALELPFTALRLSVADAEVEGKSGENAKNGELTSDGGPKSGKVTRVVDLAVDERGKDTSNTSET